MFVLEVAVAQVEAKFDVGGHVVGQLREVRDDALALRGWSGFVLNGMGRIPLDRELMVRDVVRHALDLAEERRRICWRDSRLRLRQDVHIQDVRRRWQADLKAGATRNDLLGLESAEQCVGLQRPIGVAEIVKLHGSATSEACAAGVHFGPRVAVDAAGRNMGGAVLAWTLGVGFNHFQRGIAQKEWPLTLYPDTAGPAGFTIWIARRQRAQHLGARAEDFLCILQPDATDEKD